MYEAHFELDSIDRIAHVARMPKDAADEAGASIVLAMCNALLAINLIYLRAFPETPPLYLSGVKYRRQQLSRDRWFDIPRVIRFGCGSCEDLAPWRCAELQLAGENCNLVVTMTTVPVNAQPLTLYHVLVQRAGGQMEDPSERLGMSRVPLNTISTSGGSSCGP